MLKALRVATALSIALFPSLDCIAMPAMPQESECFMVTTSGSFMDLSRLCSGGSAPVSVNKEVFQAPIKRRQHGIPVIDVTFNGTQTFEMLVDTGASGTVLSPQVATALGVIPAGKVKVDTPSDKGVEMLLGHIASIEVAGAIVKDTSVTVAPALDTGLLGQNFFRLYDVTIKENVIEFRTRH